MVAAELLKPYEDIAKENQVEAGRSVRDAKVVLTDGTEQEKNPSKERQIRKSVCDNCHTQKEDNGRATDKAIAKLNAEYPTVLLNF